MLKNNAEMKEGESTKIDDEKNTWLDVNSFMKTTKLNNNELKEMMKIGQLELKTSGDKILVRSKHMNDEISSSMGFVLGLHEKLMDAKDESISILKKENEFLRECISALQEVQLEDRNQMELLREELQMVKRKYKLMWGKVIK